MSKIFEKNSSFQVKLTIQVKFPYGKNLVFIFQELFDRIEKNSFLEEK